jgi:hypothetical protein
VIWRPKRFVREVNRHLALIGFRYCPRCYGAVALSDFGPEQSRCRPCDAKRGIRLELWQYRHRELVRQIARIIRDGRDGPEMMAERILKIVHGERGDARKG